MHHADPKFRSETGIKPELLIVLVDVVVWQWHCVCMTFTILLTFMYSQGSVQVRLECNRARLHFSLT